MVDWRIHKGNLVSPIRSLECYFREGGTSIIRATFAHSYFVHPDRVRERTPYYPNRARTSKTHYPGMKKNEPATWSGDDREVTLDDNQGAQSAWKEYTGKLVRGSGYGVRHIWGEPWNPEAFTAGWNLCYMPFWAGMLTEEQHQHIELTRAIQQAAWELYFAANPVCTPLDFVENPGLDIEEVMAGQPLLVLDCDRSRRRSPQMTATVEGNNGTTVEHITKIKKDAHRSWPDISKAVRSLQGKPHDPFRTRKVEASAKSCVRKICDETRLTFTDLESLLRQILS